MNKSGFKGLATEKRVAKLLTTEVSNVTQSQKRTMNRTDKGNIKYARSLGR